MSTTLKEWLLKTILELEEERDAVPGAVNEDAAMALAAMKIALASLEADGALACEGTITATQFKPVADLYEVTVPSGRSTTFTKDAAEASDCRVMGWSVQEYVKLERYQAAMLQGAERVTTAYKLPANTPCKEAPEHIWLQTAGVWPENGEFSELTWCSDNQHTDDTLYVRADVVADNSPVIQDGWVACSERMPHIGVPVITCCGDVVQYAAYAWDGKEWQDWYEEYDKLPASTFTHWHPRPAAPQQEVK